MNAIAPARPETSQAVAETTTLEPLKIELADVCDQCGYTDYISDIHGRLIQVGQSQAFVAVRLPGGGTLKLCGHHYGRNEAALAERGAEILDERGKINAKNESSAASSED